MKDRVLKIFFSGIAGSGLSAIAVFMADKGHIVVGSDRAFDRDSNHFLKKVFQSRGITLVSHDGKGLDKSFDLAVFSTAVEPDHPEVRKARELGIPAKTRPEYLAEITASFDTIAVSGTSGKSTTSALLAFLMNRLNLKANFIGGGRVKQFKTSSNPGNSLVGDSKHLIIEACESDGSIVNYRPQHCIVLNLDLDHHPVDKTAEMFKTLMRNTQRKIVVNSDDSNLARLLEGEPITFSISTSSRYRPDKVEYKPFSTDFSLNGTRFFLPLPGKHNLYNALSCIAFLSEIGIPLDAIADILPDFQGIDRRFDIHLNDGKHLVIDDYAHNPHKISALMQTVSYFRKDICYIFQPHGFAPTKMMKEEYIQTFIKNLRNSDHLILLPIYYAGGSASKDISSYDLADEITALGRSVEVIEEREDIFKKLDRYQTYIIFGARDETLSDFTKDIASTLRQRNKQKC
jgi:UDP-N-acetylmuramate--alanine ligase